MLEMLLGMLVGTITYKLCWKAASWHQRRLNHKIGG